ncbi:transporter substrate-binding domain-containing protein [Pelomonas sp. SE-A7]|uniref:substrate-binding periplasmic protein n=1 Tax=Pelomonas sp. SE-A7 TaxID=3054953 RepID=UPI00259D2CCF|nr:transporter substrate-binding domain-containing protein [Pelomonas sp. SE-A7]MDM4767162.1 transporter substrate-binding domain-containing protein [Pelomonas sp. SE-A7]
MLFLGLRPVQAAELRIAFALSVAPFADPRDGTGLEIDIIRAALQAAGHTIRPAFMPSARKMVALRSGEVEAAATLSPQDAPDACLSEVYIHYQDYAITAKGRYPKGIKLADLALLRVVAYQLASHHLGPEYAAAVKANPRYQEQADQLSQLRMLFGGQADVIVAERHIYEYQLKRLAASRFTEQPFAVDYVPLFKPVAYRVAFKNQALCEQFNAGLARIRREGVLDRITAAYLPVIKLPPSGDKP